MSMQCSKMRLRPCLRPGPSWGSLQRSPRLPTGFKRVASWQGGGGEEEGKEEKRKERKGSGRGRKERGGEREEKGNRLREKKWRGEKLEQGRRLAKAGPVQNKGEVADVMTYAS